MDSIADQVKALAIGTDDVTRRQILDSLRDLSYSIELPADTLERICYIPFQPALARVAIDLKIFNILVESNEPLTVEHLATKTGAAPLLLGRILRYLSSMRMIKETAKDTFTANNITKSLSLEAIQAGVYHNFDTVTPAIIALPDYLKETNYQNITELTHTPFQKAFNTTDPAFIWLPSRPHSLAAFNQFMEALEASKPHWSEIYPILEKIQTRAFDTSNPNQTLLVDVGGGIGHHTVSLKKRMPDLKNRLIVQDMAPVLESLIPYPGVAGMPHSFFEFQPIKNANFYFLSKIMHDYPDEKCVLILGHIVAAMGKDSTLLICDMVLPDCGVHWHVTQVDMTMMSTLAALERTGEQWKTLLGRAGLRIKGVYQSSLAGVEAVIECVPV